MGASYPEIDERVRAFIGAQRMFFVASAPLSGDGHVNVSPKGLDSFRVLGARRVAYLDHNGSGVETAAHVRENGRLTIMFCAFEGKPNVLRLRGRGRVVEPADAEFGALAAEFPPGDYVRSIVTLDVELIGFSCGFGVPLYEFKGERTELRDWAERKGVDGLRDYRRAKNAASIDGLPGLRTIG